MVEPSCIGYRQTKVVQPQICRKSVAKVSQLMWEELRKSVLSAKYAVSLKCRNISS